VQRVDAETVGKLIALYERAVGFYGALVNTNAYHQPGVEAGKKAAGAVLAIQKKLLAHLHGHKGEVFGLAAIASAIGADDEIETVYKVLEHLSANDHHGIKHVAGIMPLESTYMG
jgi:glucose-6-phosphate isomerase